jgi:hypothetical protein
MRKKLCINTKNGQIRKFEQCPDGWTDKMPMQNGFRLVWDDEAGRWVERATEEEKKRIQEAANLAWAEQFAEKRLHDGQEFFREYKAKYDAMLAPLPQRDVDRIDIEYAGKVLPYLKLVSSGDWWTAWRRMKNTKKPKEPENLRFFKEIFARIFHYLKENYPQFKKQYGNGID